MNAFLQHIPPFVETDTRPVPIPFNTLAELRAIEYVAYSINCPGHYRLSLSRNLLISEFNRGTHWIVLGFIKYPHWLRLPEWIEPSDQTAEPVAPLTE